MAHGDYPSPSDLDETASAAPAALEAGTQLAATDFAELVVERRIGSGGMGVVYLAHDNALDRAVAVKLIRRDARDAEALRARLMREARSLSRVVHPNVVTVHGAGVSGDQVYIIMEYVDGWTLGDWLGETKRSQAEIVDVVGQAGRGLAAAHRAGIIHRDFKPANVLVGKDGRARVTDFGLAAFAAGPVDAEPSGERPASPSVALTAAGAIVGTPRYMAPEQHTRSAVGPAADQFAFGVTLYEALTGTAPFPGSSTDELRASVLAGQLRRFPDHVPGWLARIVRRALERDPERRFPSMDALLAALARGPRVTLRRVGAALVVAGAVAATAWAVVASRREPPCRGADKIVAAVWGPAQRATVTEAFGKAKTADAPGLLPRIVKRLDAYAEDWTAARTDACEANAVRREQSDAVKDQRMACLDARLRELQAVVAVVSDASNITPLAYDVTKAIRSLPECSDVRLLSAIPPVPEGKIVDANKTLVKMAEAHLLLTVGNIAAARTAAAPLVDEARALGLPHILAETLYVVAGILDDDPRAGDWLKEALAIAADVHDDKLAALIQTRMIFLLGVKDARFAEALALVPVAMASVRRAGNADGLQAEILSFAGSVQLRSGHAEAAILSHLEARGHAAKAWGKDSMEVGETETALAEAAARLGRYGEARGYAEHALSIVEVHVGPDCYLAGRAHNELGGMAVAQGDYAGARLHYGRARDIIAQKVGPDSPSVAIIVSNLAEVDEAEGRFDEAQAKAEAALAMIVKRRGPTDMRAGWIARVLARVLVAQGKVAEARAPAEQALAAAEKLGPDHPDVAEALSSMVRLRLAEKAPADAVKLGERALAIREKSGGGPDTRIALVDLGNAYVAAGRAADAVRALDRAVGLIEPTTAPVDAADTRFALARALGPRAERARSLAAEARSAFAGAKRDKLVADVDRWLR